MNSSGIKRGLATTAVSALAIAGIPFIASSASASATDLTIAYQGPARSGGDQGAVVIFSVPQGTVINPGDVKLFKSDNTGLLTPTPNQSASIVDRGANGLPGGGDGNANDVTVVADADMVGDPATTDEYQVNIAATAANGVNSVNFSLVIDKGAPNAVDPTDLRTPVTLSVGRAPTQLSVTPSSQSAPAGQDSGDYTVAIADAAGNPTQLQLAEVVEIDPRDANTNINAAALDTTVSYDKLDLERGSATFTAKSLVETLHYIDLDIPGVPSATATATLNVVPVSRAFADDEIDVVTGADSWDGPGDGTVPGTVKVRADQTSVTINLDSIQANATDNANATVVLALDGTKPNNNVSDITFGGKKTGTATTTLNSRGEGSITITPDAGSIQAGDQFTITGLDGNNVLTVVFENAALAAVSPAAETYVSALKGTVDVTASVVDQFGNPATNAVVTAQRTAGPNTDAAPSAKKAVDAEGNVTFSFTDAKAALNQEDTVTFVAYASPTSNTTVSDTTKIRYTATGTGAPIVLLADGANGDAATYNPANVTTLPLTDGEIDGAAGTANVDYLQLDVTGGTLGAPVTISADNGALVLTNTPAETRLSQGSATQNDVIGASNIYRIVGTKTGLTTVTVTSAGVTKTIQFTVKSAVPNTTEARNVSVSGPAEAASDSIVTFTAVVSDAFGNPVPGVRVTDLNIQVTGPARLQDSDAVTNAAGELGINVRLDDDADSPVGVRVTGIPSTNQLNQFGAVANQEFSTSAANSAPGIEASNNIASATIADVTNIADLEAAVEAAEADLAAAEAALAAAQGDLDVAQSQLAIAQAEVDRLQERKQNLRQKLNKAKANDNKKKAKTTRKKLRSVKSQLRDARQAAEVAQTAVEGEQAVVAEAQQAVTEAEEALAQAEQDLEDAQN